MVISIPLALLMIAATTAQAGAPRWTTGAGFLASGTTKALTLTNVGSLTLSFSGQTLKTTLSADCTGTALAKGSAAGSPGTAENFRLECKNVESSVANCTPHGPGQGNNRLSTKQLKGTLVWLSGATIIEVGILLEPFIGTTLAEIEETGASCAVNTEGVPLKVTEKLICKFTRGVSEDVSGAEANCSSVPIVRYWTNQTPTRTEDAITQLKVAGANGTLSSTLEIAPGSGEIGIKNG